MNALRRSLCWGYFFLIAVGTNSASSAVVAEKAAISKSEAVVYVETQAKLNPDTNWNVADFFTIVGEKSSYTPTELKSYQPAKKKTAPGAEGKSRRTTRSVALALWVKVPKHPGCGAEPES